MTYESDDTRPRVARLMEPKLHVDAENADDLETDPDTALITSYLLGELTAKERGALRERMRRDPEFRENVMIMTCLLPGADALDDLNACGERFDSPGDIMLELERRRAQRIRQRRATRASVHWLRAASITGIALLLAGSMITAGVASLRHGTEPPQAVASSTPRGNGSAVASRPAATPKSGGSGSAAGSASSATTTRSLGPPAESLPPDAGSIPPARDALHESPRLVAGAPPGTPVLMHSAPASPDACDAASSRAALARELAQDFADSAARDSAQKTTRGSLARELWNAAVAEGARRAAAAAAMHPQLGVRPASAVVGASDSGSAAPKAADSTTKPAAASGKSCDGTAANPTDRRRNP